MQLWRPEFKDGAVDALYMQVPIVVGSQSTRHTLKSCDELTIVYNGVVTS